MLGYNAQKRPINETDGHPFWVFCRILNNPRQVEPLRIFRVIVEDLVTQIYVFSHVFHLFFEETK